MLPEFTQGKSPYLQKHTIEFRFHLAACVRYVILKYQYELINKGYLYNVLTFVLQSFIWVN